MKPYIKKRLWIIITALFLIFIYKTDFSAFISKIISALYPVIVAMVLSWFLLPLKVKCENAIKNKSFFKKRAATVSAFAVYLTFMVAVAFFIIYLIPILKEGIKYAYNQASGYYYILEKYVGKEVITRLTNSINPNFYIASAMGTINFVFNASMTLIVLIYVLLEHRELNKFFLSLSQVFVGSDKTEKLIYYFSKINSIFIKYFYGKSLSSLMLGAIVIIGFIFAGIGHPVFFAFIIAVSNMIPIFGAFIGIIPIVLNTFAEYGIVKTIIAVLIVIAGQQIENNIFTPKIVGNTIGLSGFWVLFTVVLSGGIFGFWGMFISIPVAATVKMFYMEFYKRKIGDL